MNTLDNHTEIWPISPTFISLQKDAYKGNPYTDDIGESHIYSPNKDGIFTSDELRGFLADASDDKDINNPLSLFQIIPNNFLYNSKDGRIKELFPSDIFIKKILQDRRIIRIDPGKLYSNFHCCDIFRKCNTPEHERLCFESDSRIALLYDKRLCCINYTSQFDLFYTTLSRIINEYNEHNKGNYPLSIEKYDNNRLYVKYQCEYSKLYEYFFPITYNGKVVAILMQGQRFHKDLERDEIFKDYVGSCRKLKISIKQIGCKKMKEEAMCEKRLSAITNRIKILEKRISVEMYAAAQWYVSDRFSFWSNRFRNKIKTINSISQTALCDYKKALSEILEEIIQTFNKGGFIRIFSMVSPLEDDNLKMDIFDLIGNSLNNEDKSYSRLKFRSLPLVVDSIEKEELIKYAQNLPSDINPKKDIFRLDTTFNSKKAYIIWKRYDDSIIYNTHFGIYCNALKSLYHTLLEPYFILDSIMLEQKLEASMRISVHESAQVIPSVIDTINTDESIEILKSGKDYNGTPTITLPMHKILDVSNRLLLLEGLFRRSTLIFKKDPPKKDWYDFHRIIYATKSMFGYSVFVQNLQSLTISSNRKFSQFKLYTDYSYLSHVLFNLMDNAIKYGLRGSKIYIKVDIEHDILMEQIFNNKDVIKYIHISVISYGSEISEETRSHMYDLYYRNSTSEIEGMGIGLFLAKKLCNLMGYTIKCENSVQISKINLPVYYCFCSQNDINKSNIGNDCLQLLRKQIPSNIIADVVNSNCTSWEITEPEVEKLILRPTYQNEFRISIPINESNLTTN